MKLRHQVATFLSVPADTHGGREPAVSAAVQEAAPVADVPAPATQAAGDSAASPDHAREAIVRELLEHCARSFVGRDEHVRANMMTFSADRSRRQVHAATAYNMEHDPDRDLEIGANAAAGEQARVRPTLKSILTVPIFHPEDIDGPLLGTLQVDSDLTVEDAGFNRPESAELLQQFADVLGLLLIGVQVRFGDGRTDTIRAAPKSRVQDASQVEPGLYVANRSTSIFQLSRTPYS